MPASLIADPFQVRELVILRLDDFAKGGPLLSHAASRASSQKQATPHTERFLISKFVYV